MENLISPSVFKNIENIEYFEFEEDFVEENMRCIPMIVRLKMDMAGIKLSLSEWSKFPAEDRIELAVKSCGNNEEAAHYRIYLDGLVKKHTGAPATPLLTGNTVKWSDVKQVPEQLQRKAGEHNWYITIEQWAGLTNLQRFALLKLIRPGHENKFFPRAMSEFKLTHDISLQRPNL